MNDDYNEVLSCMKWRIRESLVNQSKARPEEYLRKMYAGPFLLL